MKYALIDMGSNSIRLTVYNIEKNDFKILFKEKVMAGLAGYVEHGRLTQEGIECACQSLREFQSTLSLLEIEQLAVFATASLRNVSNSLQAVEQIQNNTGIKVEIISGETEAECGFYGSIYDVDTSDGLFMDIGGASTEIAFFSDQNIRKAVSIPIGSLKLYRDCVKKILPGDGARQEIENKIKDSFDEDSFKDLPKHPQVVCVGGTARACLKLCKKLFGMPEESVSFTCEQLNLLAARLCKSDKDAAQLILRYAPERIHTLIPGIMILTHLINFYNAEIITVSSYGVREGYLRRFIQPSLI